MAIVPRLDAGYHPGVGQYWVVARRQVVPAVAQRSLDSAGNWLRHHPRQLPRRYGPPCQCLALDLENLVIDPDSDVFPPLGENFRGECSGGCQGVRLGDLDATRAVRSVVSRAVSKVVSKDASMDASMVVKAVVLAEMAVRTAGMLAGMAVMLAAQVVEQVVEQVVRDSSKVIEIGSLTNDPSTNDPSTNGPWIDRPRLVHPAPDQALAQPAKNWSRVNITCKN